MKIEDVPEKYRDAFEPITNKEYIRVLEKETFLQISMINYLLEHHDLYDESGTYTFPDGQRWAKLEIH